MTGDVVNQAEEAYLSARAACRAVELSLDATDAQKTQARAARDAMWAAYSQGTLDTFAARSQVLGKLIAALDGVIATIKGGQVGGMLDGLNTAVSTLNTLLTEEDEKNGG